MHMNKKKKKDNEKGRNKMNKRKKILQWENEIERFNNRKSESER